MDSSRVSMRSGRLSYYPPTPRLSEVDSQKRIITTLSVVAMCYFTVSGGPLGSEQIISAGGPLIGIMGLAIFPVLFSIPMSLVTAELSTAFPHNGGFTLWVYTAFGPFWGFQEGYLSWISGVFDNAIYPTLIISVLTESYGTIGSPLTLYLIKAAIILVGAIPCLLGVQIVGLGLVFLGIMVMLPYLVMFFMGLSMAEWGNMLDVRHLNTGVADAEEYGPVAIDWSLLIHILFWNNNGFDSLSVFAGEVVNPSKTYPKALALSVALIAASYLIPLSIATAVNEPAWWTWNEGSFTQIAATIGGPFLSTWVVIASLCSNMGLYTSELFIDSFQLLGMAQQGLAPALFSRRCATTNTPKNAIYASLVVMLGLISFDFSEILLMNNALNGLSIMLVFLSAIKLRYSHADLVRPYRIPGGIWSMIVLVTPALIILMYIMITLSNSLKISLIALSAVIFGLMLFYVQTMWHRMELDASSFRFEDQNLDEKIIPTMPATPPLPITTSKSSSSV